MTSGQRTIDFDEHRDLVVKDFNPYAVKRIFSDHVESNELPYVETVKDISDMCIEFEEGALIDEERIIGLKVSRFSLSKEHRSKV